ncbi:MAG: hypothetical protein WDO17_27915 [Alphaproteobacteria bacterium]
MTVEDLKGSLMQRVGLVALPVLAFQRNMLGIVRTGIKDDGLLKPLQTLAQNELQALLMILDPLGKWRDSLGADMEKKLKDTFDRAGPKVISGAVSLIDAQQELLDVLIEALDKARKSQVPKKK